MRHRQHRGHGNNKAHDTFVMTCPDCGDPLMLIPDDLSIDNSIECSHCGHALQITPQRMPGGGQYWTLVGEQNDG